MDKKSIQTGQKIFDFITTWLLPKLPTEMRLPKLVWLATLDRYPSNNT
jgi:hypothetical protein